MEAKKSKPIDIRAHLNDPSLWAIILGNLFSLIIALKQGWDITQTMWVFWAQSVIIGLINTYRLASLKNFSTDGFKINGVRPKTTKATQYYVAGFFFFHFGFFHLVYALFLWDDMPLIELSHETLLYIALCAAGFFGAHSYSFRHNLTKDFAQNKPNIGSLMGYPYFRIIPMHLTIIFGQLLGPGATVLFLLLKAGADAAMHVAEHRIFQKIDQESS